MADISILARLVAGITRNTNIQNNTLVVGSLKVGTSSPTELTKAILDRLISTQDGSDLASSYHSHNSQYFTETELGSSSASSGSDLIGDDNTYSNFTPAAATVKGALSGIDSALAAGNGQVKISVADTTAQFLGASIVAGSALTSTILSPGANETLSLDVAVDNSSIEVNADALQVKAAGITSAMLAGSIDATKIADGSVTSTEFQYINTLSSNAQTQLTNNATAISDHLSDATDAHDASAISSVAAGNLSATDVQAALNELDSEKVAKSGDTMSGNLAMGGNKVTGLAASSANGDAVRHEQLQAALSSIQNFEWQKSAIDYIVDNTVAPPTEVSGDRYLLSHDGGAPHANWDGAEAGDIVEFNGSIWVETDPTTGMMISVDDETTSLRQWSGSAWVQKYFESTTASTGLVKVGFDVRLDASSAGSGLGFSAGVLSANVDDSTIEINSDALRLKALGITNAHVSASAAIVYSKLSLSNSIVNADINASAAIAYSKLALSASIVNADIAAGAAIAYAKLNLSASIVNADIAAGAAIAYSKLNLSASIVNADIASGAAIAYSKLSLSNSIVLGDMTSNSVDENKIVSTTMSTTGALDGGSGTKLSVKVDTTTIKKNGSNQLAVETLGIRDLYATFTNNTGSTIAAGKVVIASQTVAGEIVLADSDALATCEGVLGVTAESIADAASGKVQIAGRCTPTQDASYDLGKRVYVSGTAGSTTKTAPSATNSVIYLMGTAVSTTEIVLGMHLEAVVEA